MGANVIVCLGWQKLSWLALDGSPYESTFRLVGHRTEKVGNRCCKRLPRKTQLVDVKTEGGAKVIRSSFKRNGNSAEEICADKAKSANFYLSALRKYLIALFFPLVLYQKDGPYMWLSFSSLIAFEHYRCSGVLFINHLSFNPPCQTRFKYKAGQILQLSVINTEHFFSFPPCL